MYWPSGCVLLLAFALCWLVQEARSAEQLRIYPGTRIATVHPHVYGHFLEPIEHSVVDGLFAEQVRNRSFEDLDTSGGGLPAIAKTWEQCAEGAGKVAYRIIDSNPLNTAHCQEIALPGGNGWYGLRQPRFYLKAGEGYQGSLWLRGEGLRGRARIKFLSEKGIVIYSKPFQQITADWTEYSFSFRPRGTHFQATLIIEAQGTGRLYVDQVSLMSDAARRNGGFRPDLLAAIKGLRPPVIRWPGGCFAEHYRWKRGIGPQHQRLGFWNVTWGEWDDAGLGTDEFLRLCKNVGAEPLMVLNCGTHDAPEYVDQYVQEALDWIEYCNSAPDTPMGKLRARNGHLQPYHIKHWELDNETWRLGPDNYAKLVEKFSRAIRARYPELILYACGSGGYETGFSNRVIELAGQYFDRISIHHYEPPDNFAAGPARYEASWLDTAEAIRKSRNPKILIAVTEWNAMCVDWRTGLYAAGLLNTMERNGNLVKMGNPALLLRLVTATQWENAFINMDNYRWYPAPNYVVMRLFREHFAPSVIRCEAPKEMNVVTTLSEDRQTLMIKAVNPTDHPIETEIMTNRAFPITGQGQCIVVTAPSLSARNTLEEPRAIAPVKSRLSKLGQTFLHTFPAYSVSVITLHRS